MSIIFVKFLENFCYKIEVLLKLFSEESRVQWLLETSNKTCANLAKSRAYPIRFEWHIERAFRARFVSKRSEVS